MFPLLSIKQFFRDMRNQKMRTLMTMGGILWGTLAIVLLFAFGKGISTEQMKSMKGIGEDIAIVWPGSTSKPWEGLLRGRNIRFTDDDIVMMKARIRTIGRISPEYLERNIPIAYGRKISLQNVHGVWPEFGPMRNVIPEMGGRFINELDMALKRRVVFIGDRLKEELFGSKDAIGEYVLIDCVPFQVIGILKKKKQDSSYSGRDAWKAIMPSTTFKGVYSRVYPSNFVVQPRETNQMNRVKEEIYRQMAGKYKFDPDDTEALGIWDTTEMMRFIRTFFLAFRIFLIGIGLATLITGGIGVSNIMNVILEERTKEIGIKMALGAKKSMIMTQFIFETLLLTTAGGLIGFILGVGVVKVFPLFRLEDYVGVPEIDILGTVLAVGILGIVGFIAGFFPARRASNLQPVQALKLF